MFKRLLLLIVATRCVLLQAKTIKVVATEVPGLIEVSKGQPTGIFVETLSRVEKNLDIKFEFMFMPWARALEAIKKQEFDAIVPTIKSDDRLVFLDFSREEVFLSDMAFYGRATPECLNFNSDLTKHQRSHFVKLAGAKFAPAFDQAEMNKQIEVKEAKNFISAIQMVEESKVDFAAIPTYTANAILKSNKFLNVIQCRPVFFKQPLYIAFRKGFAYPEWLVRFDRELNRSKKSNH